MTTHHLILSLPPADQNVVCFSSKGPLYCPQVVNLLRSFKKSWCHFMSRIPQIQWVFFFCLTIFLVLGSNLILQRSCLFKSNCWNEIRKISFFKKVFLKFKLLWSKTQYISFKCSPLIVLYFENRNWSDVRLKLLFPVLCVYFNLWSWVYHLMVYA